MKLSLPKGLSVERFLSDYWQKRPLLMRGALRRFDFPLTPEELAGLACEEEVESRLVQQHPQNRWSLRHGPFTENDFLALPENHWTLLVQDVDKHLPAAARLLQAFDFLPSWRFDDVMVSYAVPGGSVGPHIDTYDVFLVQGMGGRRWKIQSHPRRRDLLPDLPVRILAEFEAESEWVLEEGDVLYLPPGVAHWGVAETATMNWSVGLQAPSHAVLLDSFAQFLLERMEENGHYRDPPLHAPQAPGFVSAAAVARGTAFLEQVDDPALQQEWFGRFVTELKPHLQIEPLRQPLSPQRLAHRIEKGARLRRHPFARFAWSHRPPDGHWLFASGEAHPLESVTDEWLEQLCATPSLGKELLRPQAPEILRLLTDLVNQGQLELLAP